MPKARKANTRPWFAKAGWFYVPVSLPGALVLVAGLGLAASAELVIAPHTESFLDLAYAVFPYFVCAFYIVDWIAARTSN